MSSPDSILKKVSIVAGTVVGQYKILSRLGVGGMGEVYLAQDLNLRRTVALKVLADAENPQRLRRFLREARTASALRHPNVAHIYEIGSEGQLNFIAMEYVDGLTLRQHGPVGLLQAIEIAIQIASALAAAHANGIIHRDLKPENVMISQDGYIKVLDFGLAKTMTSRSEHEAISQDPTVSADLTSAGKIVGTVSYMSPEQARGLDVDPRTDFWSLGVIIYEMITNHRPFESDTPSDVMALILHRDPQPLSRFSRDVPESVEWLVMKALDKDREGRYQTAKEMLSDLQRLRQRLSETGSSTQSGNKSVTFAAPYPVSNVSQTVSERGSSVDSLVSVIVGSKKAAITTLALLLMAAAVGLYAIYYVVRSLTTKPVAVSRTLSRLTSGPGLQSGPSWSPDGRFISYSSDRNGTFCIWIQPVGGGDPVQVTDSSSHDWQPDWSPDGNSIVFRSEREGGGLYVVPAFGGRQRKIASFGYNPRWSPDGSRILCLSPGDDYFEYPRVFIVNLDGTPPVELSTAGTGEERWIKQQLVAWHPDAKRISFLTNDGGFWTMSIPDGKPVQAEVSATVAKQLKDAGVTLRHFCWAPSGDALYLEGDSKGVLNLWKVGVDPNTLAWISGPERLTTGLGPDTEIALSKDGKRLAFVTLTKETRIWSFPFDAIGGRIRGTGQAITAADLDASFPDLSSDGRKLLFTARRQGMDRQELWQQSLHDNTASVLVIDEYTRFNPRWSPDGQEIAYSRFEAKGHQAERSYVIALMRATGGDEQLVTSVGPWRDYLYDWSPDGKWILASTNRRLKDKWEIALIPISAVPNAETAMRIVATEPSADLWAPRFSPDGRWICYLAQKPEEGGYSVLNVVSSSGGPPIRITDELSWADKPRWSPDGKTIYFISNRGSMFLNLWGIRFDPSGGKPVGEPFRITRFDSPGQMISTRISYLEMSLDSTRLCIPISKVSGSIWILGEVDR